jgi:hypothetical protein
MNILLEKPRENTKANEIFKESLINSTESLPDLGCGKQSYNHLKGSLDFPRNIT